MTPPDPFNSKAHNVDQLVSRLNHLPPFDQLQPANPSSPIGTSPMRPQRYPTPPRSPSLCTLDLPFTYRYLPKEARDDIPIVIDTFAPRTSALDSSPSSSSSYSESDSVASRLAAFNMARSSFETFVASQSRVVRVYDLPPSAERFLSAVFAPQDRSFGAIPTPVSMWALREDLGPRPESVWAVFKSHEEACATLSLSGSAMSVAPALESDLEPFHKLRRFDLRTLAPKSAPHSPSLRAHTSSQPMLHISTSFSDLASASRPNLAGSSDYILSSNPPNARTSFRLGDWICPLPKCAAHNFGRNLVCIGCGTSRSGDSAPLTTVYQTMTPSARIAPSPRFSSTFGNTSPVASSHLASPIYNHNMPPTAPSLLSPSPTHPVKSSPHPLLTPSGRAFARGGRVQNVSSDPSSPCIMWWPDNEPFPEQGQIRPGGLANMAHPPILNTGNKGPIAHQPGDWICKKCNYLNWRRRKVCQTCLPYAEGNGDSISAAVQAERIALLTSVLSNTQLDSEIVPPSFFRQSASSTPFSPTPFGDTRSQSMTPPLQQTLLADVPSMAHGPMHRSQSHFDLASQASRPIYQTSGVRQQPSPPHSAGPFQVHSPAPLLPSFLQNIVHSPAQSPSSTSSADLSLDDDEDSVLSSNRTLFGRGRNASGESTSSHASLRNIWRLDGEETKSLSTFTLPHPKDLTPLTNSRKNSLEHLHP